MMELLVIERDLSAGFQARKLRVLLGMSQQELAQKACVSRWEVNLFEHDLPVRLAARSRLTKELWTEKSKRQ
ncbi:helix-turn-helix domain-containing protein [Chloroflexota bacterium]